MIFSEAASITLPEGRVIAITVGGVLLWQEKTSGYSITPTGSSEVQA